MIEDASWLSFEIMTFEDDADTATFSGDSYEVATDNDRGTQTLATDKVSEADKRAAKRR
ncbi:hypothetical protein [uncultured Roseibium sp.]|uniref:hypothetical protein n=1 Tax=uncultured Roseibium sp. TaxID=1936171 RepID=UPI002618F32B|nr:hypothetical protein [uncultured Roseibium sp.]